MLICDLFSLKVAFYEEERDIMAKATSTWITKLQYAFQVSNIFFHMSEINLNLYTLPTCPMVNNISAYFTLQRFISENEFIYGLF